MGSPADPCAGCGHRRDRHFPTPKGAKDRCHDCPKPLSRACTWYEPAPGWQPNAADLRKAGPTSE